MLMVEAGGRWYRVSKKQRDVVNESRGSNPAISGDMVGSLGALRRTKFYSETVIQSTAVIMCSVQPSYVTCICISVPLHKLLTRIE